MFLLPLSLGDCYDLYYILAAVTIERSAAPDFLWNCYGIAAFLFNHRVWSEMPRFAQQIERFSVPTGGGRSAINNLANELKIWTLGSRILRLTFLFSVDGGWSNWGNWGTCTRTCGNGKQYSKRHCDNPAPKYGGKKCYGTNVKTRACNLKPCPGKSLNNVNTFGLSLYGSEVSENSNKTL